MEKKLEKTIASLEVQTNKVSRSFQLRNEEEVGNFSGIIMRKNVLMSFISQSSVLQKKWFKQELCQIVTSLGADLEGTAFNEEWKYRSNC